MNTNISFFHVLQSCITPIVLISGVGLLLISLMNRLGRTIDAVRKFSKDLNQVDGFEREKKLRQLKIIYKRSKLLRNGIAAITLSIFSSSIIILLILIMNVAQYELHTAAMFFLSISIGGIITAAFFMLYDVMLTLTAVSYEVEDFI